MNVLKIEKRLSSKGTLHLLMEDKLKLVTNTRFPLSGTKVSTELESHISTLLKTGFIEALTTMDDHVGILTINYPELDFHAKALLVKYTMDSRNHPCMHYNVVVKYREHTVCSTIEVY